MGINSCLSSKVGKAFTLVSSESCKTKYSSKQNIVYRPSNPFENAVNLQLSGMCWPKQLQGTAL